MPFDLGHHAPRSRPSVGPRAEAGVDASHMIWWPPNRMGQPMRDTLLQDRIGRQAARVLASTPARQHRPTEVGQAENIIQLTVDQEASVRGDLAVVEFQLQATVEIGPQMRLSGFAH